MLREKANSRFVSDSGENVLDFCLQSWEEKKFSSQVAHTVFNDLLNAGAQFEEMLHFPKIPGDYYRYGSLSLLKQMLESGLGVSPRGTSLQENRTTLPVLHEAVCNPSAELLEFLVCQQKLNLETKDGQGRTFLLFSCQEAHRTSLDKIILLVNHGAVLGCTDDKNHSILESCIRSPYGCFNLIWLMKRQPASSIIKILPILKQYNRPFASRQVYKYLAVLAYKKKLGRVCLNVENTIHSQYWLQCNSELSCMSKYSIGDRKLIDFIGVNELSTIAREEEMIHQVFSLDLREVFPIYWSDLLHDLQEVVERQRLVMSAFKGVAKIVRFGYKSCHIFMEMLTYHLSNVDLENLSKI